MGFPDGSVVKNLPAMPQMREMSVGSLGQKDPLEEEVATQYNILAWEIPQREEPGAEIWGAAPNIQKERYK